MSIPTFRDERVNYRMLADDTARRQRRMRVTVGLQAHLEQYSPNGQSVFEYALSEGAAVRTLIRRLNVPEELASVIIVNEGITGLADSLRDGDGMTLIPPPAGG